MLHNFTMLGGQRGKILIQGNLGTATVPRTMDLYTFTELKTANVYGSVNFKAASVSTVPVNLNGNVAGTLTFEQGLANLVRVGGSVNGSGSGIRVLTAGGLTGQVIIGADGATGAAISRTVEIGPSGSSVILSPFPAYTQTSASLGGGAIGVAPFLLHEIDCKPLNPAGPAAISNVTQVRKNDWLNTPDTISEQFYGPLLVSQTAGVEVDPSLLGIKVMYCFLDQYLTAYESDVTYKFVAYVPTGSVNRRIFIRPKCDVLYNSPTEEEGGTNGDLRGIYKVTNATSGLPANTLRCKFVGSPGSEPQVAPFSRYFRFWCSPADLGMAAGLTGADGGLDNNDYISFGNLFAASDSRADLGVAGGGPGQDGLFDNNDYIAFTNFFFDGCETIRKVCQPGFAAPVPTVDEMMVSGAAPASSDVERQRQLNALMAAYQATGDTRILERINALTTGADR